MSVDVSVVIAAYNVEDYIERAVRSALEQEGVSLEVIVVDDCSGDGTIAVLSGIDDPRLRLIQSPENGGAGAARNIGFSAACGQWIAVLDGDDAYAPGRLARCIGRGEEAEAHIVVDNLMVDRVSDDATFTMFPEGFFAALERIDLPRFLDEKVSTSCSYTLGYLKPIFLTSFLRDHGLAYDPSLSIGEDYLLFAEALACGAGCVVEPSGGYIYTVRAGSLSHRLPAGALVRMLEAGDEFRARYDLDPASLAAHDRRADMLRDRYAYILLVDAIKCKNVVAVWRAIKMNPSCIFYLREPLKARILRVSRLFLKRGVGGG